MLCQYVAGGSARCFAAPRASPALSAAQSLYSPALLAAASFNSPACRI